MKELYKADFIGTIKIEDLNPVGYKISFYVSRGSENPVVIISDLPDDEFIPFLKEEIRAKKFNKTKYFSTTKIEDDKSCFAPYGYAHNQYVTSVSENLVLHFKDEFICIPYNAGGYLIPVIANVRWFVEIDETDDYIIEYEGRGSGYIKLTPKENHDVDKEFEIKIISDCGSVQDVLKVTQLGIRETFKVKEGDFILLRNQTFNVLKDGLLKQVLRKRGRANIR